MRGACELFFLFLFSPAGNSDPKKMSMTEIFKTGIVLTEIAAYEPATQIAGTEIILDMSGLTMNHVRQVTPALVKKMMDYAMVNKYLCVARSFQKPILLLKFTVISTPCSSDPDHSGMRGCMW